MEDRLFGDQFSNQFSRFVDNLYSIVAKRKRDEKNDLKCIRLARFSYDLQERKERWKIITRCLPGRREFFARFLDEIERSKQHVYTRMCMHGKTHFSLGFFTILSLYVFSPRFFLLPPPFYLSLERETTILLNPLDDKEK